MTPTSGAAPCGVDEPRETLFRVGARSLTASLVVETALGLVLLAGWRLAYGTWLPWPLAGYLLGAAAGGGVAFALAEVATRRWGLLAGLGSGLAATPLVLLGGDFALLLLAHLDPRAALGALLDDLDGAWLRGLGLFAAGALALYGPLLAARRRGAPPTRQGAAMAAGALVWSAAALLAPLEHAALNLAAYALLVLGRVPLVPLALVLGDRCVDGVLAQLGQGDVEAPARTARARGGPGSPADRHRARRLEAKGAELLAAGRAAEAAEALEEAHAAWPTARRAEGAARAWAAADEPFRAIERMGEALALPGGPGPELLDDPAFAHLQTLPELAALRPDPAPPAAPGDEATGLTAREPRAPAGRLALACLASLPLALVLLPALAHPRESAATTLQRLRAHLEGPRAWVALGDRLARGGGGEVRIGAGLPDALVRTGADGGLDAADDLAAEAAYARAAAAGHAEAMFRVAEIRAWFGEGVARPEAVAWYRRAAEAGWPPAMHQLGWVLESGWGGAARDPAAAETWYLRAADAGHDEALIRLAALLETQGRAAEAAAAYERAAARGHPVGLERSRELAGR